jgi:hypothetical protein
VHFETLDGILIPFGWTYITDEGISETVSETFRIVNDSEVAVVATFSWEESQSYGFINVVPDTIPLGIGESFDFTVTLAISANAPVADQIQSCEVYDQSQ